MKYSSIKNNYINNSTLILLLASRVYNKTYFLLFMWLRGTHEIIHFTSVYLTYSMAEVRGKLHI